MTDVQANRRRGPRPAHLRLRRLLVMLPWLMERGEVPLDEMARRFGLTEAELVADLELASMCGLPPFVDELIDVFVDEGMVYAGVPRVFTKPLRLTAPEAFALMAAGRAALELPGAEHDGPLSRALSKLDAALGEAELRVELSAPEGSDELASAAAAGEVLEIQYWSARTESSTRRRIAPRSVFSDRGHWYLLADDLDLLTLGADAERTFRLDRIESVTPTGDRVPTREATPPREWFADDSMTTTVLRLAPPAMWAVERYPVRSVSPRDDGRADVELAVVSERWLSRLLLRLGPEAEVVEPERWRDLAARTAAEVLTRY
jgi:proteasome accessory factor C